MVYHILIGVTGSVATIKIKEIVHEIHKIMPDVIDSEQDKLL
jgi:hypothetical protein